MKSTFSIYLIRHGDRFDYQLGKDAWTTLSSPLSIRDPPLSNLGNIMALETAEYLSKVSNPNTAPMGKIFTSPFLRCIETANPIAEILSSKLFVEDSLFEYGQTDEELPNSTERSRYFPLIDISYQSQFKPRLDERVPDESIERFGKAVHGLVEKYGGENICLVSHAAGVVAMVAALIGCTVRDVPAAAPCSIYRVDWSDGCFTLSPDLRGSIEHLSRMGRTGAWPLIGKSEECDSFITAGDSSSWVVQAAPKKQKRELDLDSPLDNDS